MDSATLMPNTPHNIAILTSGGDAPGMNAAIRASIRTAHHYKLKTFVIRDGYNGMIEDMIDEFKWEDCGQILQEGGTLIGTARSSRFREKEGRKEAAYNLVSRGIDGLVVIGGDGTLMGASILSSEWTEHLEVLVREGRLSQEQIDSRTKLHFVGLSGSIDNDMYGTDNTIGADTALHRICEAIDHIATTASSHKRAFVMEVMGRNCGYLALMSAVVTGADWLVIPEDPLGENWEEEMCSTINNGRCSGKTCSIVVLSEGARDKKGHPIKSDYVREVLEKRLKLDTRVTILGHIQRGGPPTAYDRYLATVTGVEAVKTLMNPLVKEPQLIGMTGLQFTSVPVLPAVQENMKIAAAAKENNFDFVIQRKHRAFKENLRLYNVLKDSMPPQMKTNEKPKFTVAVTSVGAPAPGMNTFFRAVTRLSLSEGYRVLAIKGGFLGLIEDSVEEFGWMSVNGWAPLGGCTLGTNRDLPSENMKKVVEQIEKYKIDAMIFVGGFEAYHGVAQLYKARDMFPQLRKLAVVVAPATISNNLPATDYSIGIDRALNNLVDATDKIKQSSIGYCDRIFLVQVMGGYCGFQALMGSLISGAEGYFLHEDEIRLKNIIEYLDDFKYRFNSKDPKLSLFVINEKTSEYYPLHVMQKIFDRETEDGIAVRTSELGSIQHGGNPTPFDRITAGAFALEAVTFVSKQFEQSEHRNGTIMGTRKGEIFHTSIPDILPQMDFTFRRPVYEWWMRLKTYARLLSQKDLSEELRKEYLQYRSNETCSHK
mmetsp:Transcript_3539/g.13539  ORF Transcript_3539/g.13539 Transcript_3539/m.13539 type:complete len:767 (-) Transcript_3539:208-2508(-)